MLRGDRFPGWVLPLPRGSLSQRLLPTQVRFGAKASTRRSPGRGFQAFKNGRPGMLLSEGCTVSPKNCWPDARHGLQVQQLSRRRRRAAGRPPGRGGAAAWSGAFAGWSTACGSCTTSTSASRRVSAACRHPPPPGFVSHSWCRRLCQASPQVLSSRGRLVRRGSIPNLHRRLASQQSRLWKEERRITRRSVLGATFQATEGRSWSQETHEKHLLSQRFRGSDGPELTDIAHQGQDAVRPSAAPGARQGLSSLASGWATPGAGLAAETRLLGATADRGTAAGRLELASFALRVKHRKQRTSAGRFGVDSLLEHPFFAAQAGVRKNKQVRARVIAQAQRRILSFSPANKNLTDRADCVEEAFILRFNRQVVRDAGDGVAVDEDEDYPARAYAALELLERQMNGLRRQLCQVSVPLQLLRRDQWRPQSLVIPPLAAQSWFCCWRLASKRFKQWRLGWSSDCRVEHLSQICCRKL